MQLIILRSLRLFVLLAVFTASAHALSAQIVTNAPYLGLKMALNYSSNSISDPDLQGYDVAFKAGVAGGLFYNIPVINKVSIQPELMYAQFGSKLNSTAGESGNVIMPINYVTMPVLIKFSPLENLGLFAGPEIMYKASAKLNPESGDDIDIANDLTDVDLALTVGAEYWFTKNIGVYARYIQGFTNVNKADPGIYLDQQFVSSKISNRAIQAGITIGFPGGETLDPLPLDRADDVITEPAVVSEVVTIKDRDGDGIVDKDDECPDDPGIADNLGCPEMILYYKRASVELDSFDKASLDRIAEFMKANPKLNILIEGHTSTLGETEYNQKLSEGRAKASFDYLIAKGISGKRMKTIGYGENYPVGDNNTEEGRALSRRVVIRVVK
jgi:outer membrane protein OmpA-like peptidoglycan-associated protein